ncbi:hypothetical protein NSK_000507 [Nannochloropsis salina CCMP1776]|uniref:Uncharacterized protein n=1 Tax=Nannochloropsis salina CCMP1776 TaxID=1027361 RepID=A0A4D9DDG8_9STRA|nr:hypothetical protein NSK_000507 [Nannochloropsis salina CCMP1776]|eukprot:TFJ88153.1 hypothetical protein NSK_000507 [Nannochloropsis salina CCMP1776]
MVRTRSRSPEQPVPAAVFPVAAAATPAEDRQGYDANRSAWNSSHSSNSSCDCNHSPNHSSHDSSHAPPSRPLTPTFFDAVASPARGEMLTLGDLECGVCLGLLCEAVTTPCGHSLCRLCLVRALQRQTKCPVCRAVCMINAEDHAETRLLTRLAKRAFPALYEQRLEETRQEREALKLLLPIFFYNLPIFPGEALRLHLFEPRYRLMMQRIVNGSRRFAYVPNYSNYRAKAGDIALIAELKEVRFMRDGRSELEARIAGRFTIAEDPYVEDGTGGLSYCRLKELRDESPKSAEASQALRQASEKAREMAHAIFLERRDIKAVVVDRYGEMPGPQTPEALSLWIAAVLPTENRQIKHDLLVSTDTSHRLEVCMSKLQALRGAGMGKSS